MARHPFRFHDQSRIFNLFSRLGAASALAAGCLVACSTAQARITQITISTSGVAFGGYSFPGVGPYKVITGIATGEIDPLSPQYALITDIQLAPRNANGKVVYQHNFYILTPMDPTKSNHKMMYEPPNRDGKTYQGINNTPTGTNDPAALADPTALSDSFFWTRGYTTVWSGWENNEGPLTGLTATAAFPVIAGPGNTPITGTGYEYIVTGAATYTLAYPAATGKQGAPDAVLTHRIHLDDTADPVPVAGWAYTDATRTAIKLTTGNFVNNDIYEFSYTAMNPTPNGMGFAAIRDFNSFLRYSRENSKGLSNPLADVDIKSILTEVVSQPARTTSV